MTRNLNYTFTALLLASTSEQHVFLIHKDVVEGTAENISKIEIIQLFR